MSACLTVVTSLAQLSTIHSALTDLTKQGVELHVHSLKLLPNLPPGKLVENQKQNVIGKNVLSQPTIDSLQTSVSTPSRSIVRLPNRKRKFGCQDPVALAVERRVVVDPVPSGPLGGAESAAMEHDSVDPDAQLSPVSGAQDPYDVEHAEFMADRV